VGWLGGGTAVLALAIGCFLSFTVAISRQQVSAGAISVGDTLPDFKAPDEDEEPFQAASLAGRPVLLKFFRGHW
jgi:cytochrome oxidase Cu insertion factor (SCO1/SenC/PrrC family)